MQQKVNSVYYGYSFGSRPPQKMKLTTSLTTNINLFVLHRTKCKPMHFEWERFFDYFRAEL